MDASYRFAVRFRLVPDRTDVHVSPDEFETTLRYDAPAPDEGDDWLFFRDHLWRGDLNDPVGFREVVGDALSVPVEGVEFRAFETDPEYLDALREAVAGSLEEFRADSVDEVLTKYLGSAIEVERGEDL